MTTNSCWACEQSMSSGKSCAMTAITLDGVSFPRIRRGDTQYLDNTERYCSDCHVTEGGFHHPGCSKEQCPQCRDQLFCCSCEKGEGEYEDDED